MIPVTFTKKGPFGLKGETREVTDKAALQFAKAKLIENADKVVEVVEKRQAAAKAKELKEQTMAQKIADEKLAARKAELAKLQDAGEQAKKELKDKIETKEEKGAKTTKAPKL